MRTGGACSLTRPRDSSENKVGVEASHIPPQHSPGCHETSVLSKILLDVNERCSVGTYTTVDFDFSDGETAIPKAVVSVARELILSLGQTPKPVRTACISSCTLDTSYLFIP